MTTTDTAPVGYEESSTCNREGCTGKIETHPRENCSCHINPPCSYCTEPRNFCPDCGWEEADEPMPEPVVYSCPWPNPLGDRYFMPWWQHYGPPAPFILQSPVCMLQIWSNPRNVEFRANHPYRVDLISGQWPAESLIDICDNGAFNRGQRHFGGYVQYASIDNPSVRYVTVYVD